jgi:hypothetical protein
MGNVAPAPVKLAAKAAETLMAAKMPAARAKRTGFIDLSLFLGTATVALRIRLRAEP